MSRQRVQGFSFRKLPDTVFDAVGDFKKVSGGTAEKMKQLCNKGEDYQNAVINLAEKISKGKLDMKN